MKKRVSILLAILIVCSCMAGCGTTYKASEEAAEIAVDAAGIGAGYLAGRIEQDDASDRLERLYSKMEDMEPFEEEYSLGDDHIETIIFCMKTSIICDDGNQNTYDKIQEYVDDLYEYE